ncbi:hypothetical protein OG871_40530 (plasmid) [Kitasatospora sp. NBC_00374]|uniref:hypothetical protein n=1 Tax=Kitasatospora sp. NBC_00374 TaxID=2975964 RepID=UPI002F91761B
MTTDTNETPNPPVLDRNGVAIESGAVVWLHGTEQGRVPAMVTGWDKATGHPRVAVADPAQNVWEVTVADPQRLEIMAPDPRIAEAEHNGEPSDAWLILDKHDQVLGRTVGERMEDARRAAERLPSVRHVAGRDGGFALRRLSENKLTAGDRSRLEAYREALKTAGATRPVGEAVSVPPQPRA